MSGAITGRTRVIAIIAHPADHVRTPQVLNTLIAEDKTDAVVVPLDVPPAGLAAAIEGLRMGANLAGLIVTVPHKGAARLLCDRLSDRSRAVKAVNVVRREPDGTLHGDILDGEGFCDGLATQGRTVRGARIYLAGAGGAASAIAFALCNRGVGALTIANRSESKATALAERLARQFPQVDLRAGRDPGSHGVAINGTSLGLLAGDALPFDPAALSPGTLVAEVVMCPEITRLLKAAAALGLPIHAGRHMLDAQAVRMLDFLTCTKNMSA